MTRAFSLTRPQFPTCSPQPAPMSIATLKQKLLHGAPLPTLPLQTATPATEHHRPALQLHRPVDSQGVIPGIMFTSPGLPAARSAIPVIPDSFMAPAPVALCAFRATCGIRSIIWNPVQLTPGP